MESHLGVHARRRAGSASGLLALGKLLSSAVFDASNASDQSFAKLIGQALNA
jgi:hypothetical protein